MHGTHTNINLLVTDDWGRSLLAAGCFLRFGASRVQPCSLVLSQHALSVKYTTIFGRCGTADGGISNFTNYRPLWCVLGLSSLTKAATFRWDFTPFGKSSTTTTVRTCPVCLLALVELTIVMDRVAGFNAVMYSADESVDSHVRPSSDRPSVMGQT
jgi:hypothetical protein